MNAPQSIIVNFKEWLRDATYSNWNKYFALGSRPQVGTDLQISCQSNTCKRQQPFHFTYPNGQLWQFLCAVMWTAHVIMAIACRNWMQTTQLIWFLKEGLTLQHYTQRNQAVITMCSSNLLEQNPGFPCSCAKIFSSCQCACTLIQGDFSFFFFFNITRRDGWISIAWQNACMIFLNEGYQQQLVLLV